MLGEAPFDVVVLAVDVGRERATDRHVAGARGHRHEPTEGDDSAHQLVEAETGVGRHSACLHVEGAQGGEPGHVEHRAAGVLRGVAVAAAQAARDDTALARRLERDTDLLGDGGPEDRGPRRGGAAPTGQQLGVSQAQLPT